jgi:chromosome segregation ATPase
MRWQLQRWIWPAVAVLAVAVAAWQISAGRQLSARNSQLAAENQRLRQGAANLAQSPEPSAAPAGPERTAGEIARPCVTSPQKDHDDSAVQRLTQSLADANASAAKLESRVEQTEADAQKLSAENSRLESSESDLKKNLAAADQAREALEEELKIAKERAAHLESAERDAEANLQKLRDQNHGDAEKLADLQKLSSQLQDLYRRRETYLNGILRRYKQITEQYRSLQGVLQSQHTGTPDVGSADLARIQDAIALTEEDLRQLNALNSQALLVQKKIAGK